MKEIEGKCKECKWFDDDTDWCFNPKKQGATATLWSCEDWDISEEYQMGTVACDLSMKVYMVCIEVEDDYIGQGLYNDHTEIVAVCSTKEKAEQKAKELQDSDGGNYYVNEVEVE